MSTEHIIGAIGLLTWGVGLVLCLIVLRRQIHELRLYSTVRPYRWTLFIINLITIFTYVLPFILAFVRLMTGETTALLRISASLSVGVFVLTISVGLFLMYVIFSKRRS